MRRCMTPRCPYPAVGGRARCGRHGPSNAKWWQGVGTNPYDWAHQQRRQARMDAGEGCAMRHLGGCRGELHLDHIIPLSLGGRTGSDNEQILCARHNIRKGGRNRIPKS